MNIADNGLNTSSWAQLRYSPPTSSHKVLFD